MRALVLAFSMLASPLAAQDDLLRIEVVDRQGAPYEGAEVVVADRVFWTHEEGVVTLPHPRVTHPGGQLGVDVYAEGVHRRVRVDGEAVVRVPLPVAAPPPPCALDLGFAIELGNLDHEALAEEGRRIARIVRRLRAETRCLDLQVGVVLYAGRFTDAWPTVLPLTRDVPQLLAALRQVPLPTTRGAYPGTLVDALPFALSLGWRSGRARRTLLVLTDDAIELADAHAERRLDEALRTASRIDVRFTALLGRSTEWDASRPLPTRRAER